jgi:hypothetical protein
MTKPLSFTQAGLKRAIAAARATGLRVKEIKQDGTLIVEEPGLAPESVVTQNEEATAGDPWRVVKA